MEQGSKQGFVCQWSFSSEVALLRQVCVKETPFLLFLHPQPLAEAQKVLYSLQISSCEEM